MERNPIEAALEGLVNDLANLAIIDLLSILASLSLITGAVGYFLDADERKKQTHYQAWGVINSAVGREAESGRKAAIEDLWADRVSLTGLDIHRAVIPELNLSPQCYLAEIQFTKIVCDRASWFPLVRLIGANLLFANLQGARLWEANLEEINLAAANLQGANLWSANLEKANLRSSNLKGAILNLANLKGAALLDTNLEGSSLLKANLEGASLLNSNLVGVNLGGANLQGAYLSQANLSKANLGGVNLKDATLGGTDPAGVKYEVANLEGTRFCKTIMPNGEVRNDHCEEDWEPPSEEEE